VTPSTPSTPGGVIRTWNPGAERLYGYASHEAVGLPGLSLVPEGRYDEASMALECVLAGEPVELFETEARRNDGVVVPVALTLWPVRDRSGQAVGVSVIARDLTEDRLAQAALAESEVRLRESESLAHVGGWVWDVMTGAVQWSAELHRIHGMDPAEFAGTIEAHLEPRDGAGPHEAARHRPAVGVRLDCPVLTPSPRGGIVLTSRSPPAGGEQPPLALRDDEVALHPCGAMPGLVAPPGRTRRTIIFTASYPLYSGK
jgi:PAS domain S-box-containing protein